MTTSQESEGWAAWLQLLRPGRASCAFVSDFEAAAREIEAFSLAGVPPTFVVQLDWEELPRLDEELGRAARALGKAVSRVWPSIYGRSSRGSDLEEMLAAGRAIPGVMTSALRRIVVACAKGEEPQLERYPLTDRVRQLVLALSPEHPILVLSARSRHVSRDRALAFARGAEWLADKSGAPVLALLPRELAQYRELDHIAYGAFHEPSAFEGAPSSGAGARMGDLELPRPVLTSRGPTPENLDSAVAERPGAPSSEGGSLSAKNEARTSNEGAAAPRLALGRVLGRPHFASDSEKLLHARITGDSELCALFHYNRPIRTASGRDPIVDLIWPEGRLVIEIDEESHRDLKRFVDDRRRDVELILHGYTVARFSAYDVLIETDTTLRRIRELVRFMNEKKEGVAS